METYNELIERASEQGFSVIDDLDLGIAIVQTEDGWNEPMGYFRINDDGTVLEIEGEFYLRELEG